MFAGVGRCGQRASCLFRGWFWFVFLGSREFWQIIGGQREADSGLMHDSGFMMQDGRKVGWTGQSAIDWTGRVVIISKVTFGYICRNFAAFRMGL